MKAIDIRLDSDDDLYIGKGDFDVEQSDERHIQHILVSAKGSWKTTPLTGVGIYDYLLSPNTQITTDRLAQKIKLQLEYDNYKEIKINMQSIQKIKIDAIRKN